MHFCEKKQVKEALRINDKAELKDKEGSERSLKATHYNSRRLKPGEWHVQWEIVAWLVQVVVLDGIDEDGVVLLQGVEVLIDVAVDHVGAVVLRDAVFVALVVGVALKTSKLYFSLFCRLTSDLDLSLLNPSLLCCIGLQGFNRQLGTL